MTFSLIGRCAKTGHFGMVISSSSPAVAARCVHLRPGTGVVASQNVTDPALGNLVLDGMDAGRDAEQAVQSIVQQRPHIHYRQLMALGHSGKAAIFSGSQVLGCWGEAMGKNCAAAGNLLATERVPQVMVEAFEATEGELGFRLMRALRAGLDAGGEAGPVHSAGMKMSGDLSWPVADLRIDWSLDCPIAALEAAWDVYQPQMLDYVQRAIEPTQARSYGVPGDE